MHSGALVSAALLTAPFPAFAKRSKYKMGLQLYTVRAAMQSDASGTLKEIASMGYEDLETYGFDQAQFKYYGLKAAEFKTLLDDNNLSTSSGHYDLFKYLNTPEEELLRYVDLCIEGARVLKQKYITWPWLDPDSKTLDKFKLLAKKLNVIGERITKAGLNLAYHNHDFEFVDYNGTNGYTIIMNETDASLVKLQIDLYWAVHSSKLTPGELFSQQPGRFVMWHIKDMDKVTRDYTELGNGSIDYSKILPDAARSGMEYYFIEQGGNFTVNSLQSVADSARFFKKNLQRYLE
jgi:sugar phosphate isomerase/epimerase